jgi:hypothetical protein
MGLAEPLRESLAPYSDKIKTAFVYGSVARGSDTARSDVDLMVIGEDLAYPDLFGGLQKAESVLHRQVNPNFRSIEDWRRKLAQKNPFITKINAQPKVFIFGSEDDLLRVAETEEVVVKWTRPGSEVLHQLRNHRRALAASAASYDLGEKWEAQRLATAVYTLVHDGGRNSRSILTQLQIRTSLRYMSTALPSNPRNLLPESLLVELSLGSHGVDALPVLDQGPRRDAVQFETWWEKETIYRSGAASLSRRQLVFALRNKDGGSHLDAELEGVDGYLLMSRESARSWFFTREREIPSAVLGIETASMRQISWELMKTLESLPPELQ